MYPVTIIASRALVLPRANERFSQFVSLALAEANVLLVAYVIQSVEANKNPAGVVKGEEGKSSPVAGQRKTSEMAWKSRRERSLIREN
jgi:hypothetical protein